MNTNNYVTKKQITEKILKTYQYGSRVYGCHTKESDYDFIVVVESDDKFEYSVSYSNSDFSVYSEPLFIEMIKEHKIHILECIFQNKNDNYLKYFELDKEKLRRAVSSVASNSFVKCKKKMNQGDVYIGKKSLFHSLRILGFGIQIALSGRIVDYTAYNHYYDKIISMDSKDWTAYKKVFQPEFNKKKSIFRKVAPLNEEL